MIGQRFREKKRAVLDVWERYKAHRGTSEDGVDPVFLEHRAKALGEDRYVLAVVGEAKAGKSTFINALLGERILPTDVLQSSSAIVEIFKSDKRYVKVEYADGHSETIHDDASTPDVDEAFEHLRRVGALQDRFRNIPTTLIDAWIVEGRIARGEPIPLDELKTAGRLPIEGKEGLIEEYIKERELKHIPVEITFGFPLKYAFDELRLVDSPGVNALGGVQDRTFEYLYKADAVLFVHSLESPVEQSSFRDFITKVMPDRTRDVLFLVLTKSGLRSDIEIEEKISEARSLFSQEFDPQRVIRVDSMLNMVSNDILQFDSPIALKQHYTEREKHFRERYRAEKRQEWRDEAVNYDTKLKLLNNILEATGTDATRDAVHQALRQRSNFDELEHALNEFSAKAPELQLSELLTAVRRGYENQFAAHEQTIDLLGKKRKHPQTFENEISEIQRVLGEYNHELNKFTEDMHRRHTGVHSIIRKEVQPIKDKYVGQMDSVRSEDYVRKVFLDFEGACASLVDRVAAEIREGFQAKSFQLGSDIKAQHNITVPVVDVAGIVEQAKTNAYEKYQEKVPPKGRWDEFLQWLGFRGKKYFSQTRFNPQRYVIELQRLAMAKIKEMADSTPSIISILLEEYSTVFKAALEKLISARKAALEEIKTQKATNDEILRQITDAERKKKDVQTELHKIDEMLEDLR